MIFRKMMETDVQEVSRLESEIFTDAWSEDAFLDSLKNPNALLYIAKEGADILGYCCMYVVADEGEIVNVAVNPLYRQRGIAQTMLKALLADEIAQPVTYYYLEVREHNEAAKRLYSKLGFEVIGLRKNFYEMPVENALVMQKIRTV